MIDLKYLFTRKDDYSICYGKNLKTIFNETKQFSKNQLDKYIDELINEFSLRLSNNREEVIDTYYKLLKSILSNRLVCVKVELIRYHLLVNTMLKLKFTQTKRFGKLFINNLSYQPDQIVTNLQNSVVKDITCPLSKESQKALLHWYYMSDFRTDINTVVSKIRDEKLIKFLPKYIDKHDIRNLDSDNMCKYIGALNKFTTNEVIKILCGELYKNNSFDMFISWHNFIFDFGGQPYLEQRSDYDKIISRLASKISRERSLSCVLDASFKYLKFPKERCIEFCDYQGIQRASGELVFSHYPLEKINLSHLSEEDRKEVIDTAVDNLLNHYKEQSSSYKEKLLKEKAP